MDKHSVQIAVIVDGKIMSTTDVSNKMYRLYSQAEESNPSMKFSRTPEALAALCEAAYTSDYCLERAEDHCGNDSFADYLIEQEVFESIHNWYGLDSSGKPIIKYAKVFKVKDILDGTCKEYTCIEAYPDHRASNPDWYIAGFDYLQTILDGEPEQLGEVTVHEDMGYPFTGPEEVQMMLYKYKDEFYVSAAEHAKHFPCD